MMLFLAAIPRTVTNPIIEPRESEPLLNRTLITQPVNAKGILNRMSNARRRDKKSMKN